MITQQPRASQRDKQTPTDKLNELAVTLGTQVLRGELDEREAHDTLLRELVTLPSLIRHSMSLWHQYPVLRTVYGAPDHLHAEVIEHLASKLQRGHHSFAYMLLYGSTFSGWVFSCLAFATPMILRSARRKAAKSPILVDWPELYGRERGEGDGYHDIVGPDDERHPMEWRIDDASGNPYRFDAGIDREMVDSLPTSVVASRRQVIAAIALAVRLGFANSVNAIPCSDEDAAALRELREAIAAAPSLAAQLVATVEDEEAHPAPEGTPASWLGCVRAIVSRWSQVQRRDFDAMPERYQAAVVIAGLFSARQRYTFFREHPEWKELVRHGANGDSGA